MKKLISLLIVCAMLIGMTACKRPGTSSNGGTPETYSPAPNGTNEPGNLQENKTQADLDFEALDMEVFVSLVTSDGLTYHQFVIDPASFSIDESEVERGWGELSREEAEKSYAEDEELLERLGEIDREQLSDRNKTAYDNMVKSLEDSDGGMEFYYYSEPLTTLNGEHTTLPLMLTMYDINDAGDVENYLYLLEDSPRYIGQIEQFEKEKAAEGLFMSENALDQVVESCRDFAEEGGDCFLIGYLEDILDGKELGLTGEQKQAYLVRSSDCILNELLPAYTKLADTLESLRGSCGEFTGAASRGEKAVEYYKRGLREKGGFALDSGKISEILDTACSDTYADMYRQLLLSLAEMENYDKPVTSGSAEEDVEYLLELIKGSYPEIGEQEITYVTVPDAVAENFSPAAYLISAYDDPSRNIVMLNPTSSDPNLLFTLAHECFPGHLYQTQYFRASEGLSKTQQLIAPAGYTEGWAVFSEMAIAGEAEKYGVGICTIKQLESILGNILIPAYLSTKVNLDGWTKDEMRVYLSEYGLDSDDYIDVIYEYAVDMPLYFFDYALGYTYTSLIYESAAPKSQEERKEFFQKYLDFGPCRFDILFDKFNTEP